jgi:two-component system, NarL family, invasion response regulator UvrY
MDIFLVDDHALMRDGLRSLLQARGHHVVGEAADAQTAIHALLNLTPAVVLLDLQLANSSGMDVLAELQRSQHRAQVLVMTMLAQPRLVSRALQLGAAGYLLKGASAQELLTAVDTVAQGRRYFSAEVLPFVSAGDGGSDEEPPLSAREQHIVCLVVQGLSSTAIGEQLQLSPKTVDSYRSRLMSKLALADVPALVRWAIRTGLVDAKAS